MCLENYPSASVYVYWDERNCNLYNLYYNLVDAHDHSVLLHDHLSVLIHVDVFSQ